MPPTAATRKRPVARPKRLPPLAAAMPCVAAAGSGHDILARVLETARRSAELASLDRIVLTLEVETLAQCAERFGAPARCNEALRRMLATAPPWDSGGRLAAPERLAKSHSSLGFDCGVPSLDDWLQTRAFDNQQVGGSRTYVLCEGGRIAGYYTLAAGNLRVPGGFSGSRVPQPISVAILSRVASARCRRRQGLGRALVRDAMLRLLQCTGALPIDGVLAEAISDGSRAFFAALGFEASPLDGTTMLASFADLRLAAR